MVSMEIMGTLDIEDIIKATGGKVVFGNGNPPVFTGVSIDSRTIKEGEIFVALRGAKFDGHDFLYNALEKAKGALVNFPPAEPVKGKVIIYVKNTLKALQDIARYMRVRSNAPVIGITGTNGKTTTKELIASVLNRKFRVLRNTGNLNNHIGLPLSMTRLGNEEMIVLEMGASASGDIKELCGIAIPDYGVITNIGPGHLEGFGSIEAVRNAKLELLETVKGAVINSDDRFLMEGVENKYRGGLTTFGIYNKADISAQEIDIKKRGSSFLLCSEAGQIRIDLNLQGIFNIYNALAAASVGHIFDIGLDDIKAGIESFEGVHMRLEIKELLGATVISDMYNANPASMEEAVKELIRLRKERSIAVLGDMLELGSYAEEAHRKLGDWMSRIPVDVFIAVGPLMAIAEAEFARSGKQSFRAKSALEARDVLAGICCKESDTVLVKGSRGMGMEKVLDMNKESENAL